jgi:hypothetical protein
MLLVSLGLESAVFGRWWAGYHLVNVGLHLIATLLVFGFTRASLRAFGYDRAIALWASLLAACIFGVHPVLSDAVNSVFNSSEIYVTICTVGALWYLLANVVEKPIRSWLLVSALFMLGLLYRENAVALPVLAVLMLWMTSSEKWPARLFRCLPVLMLLIPLVLYAALRVNALKAPEALPQPAQAQSAIAVKGVESRSESDGRYHELGVPSGEIQKGEETPENLLPERLETSGADRDPMSALGVRADLGRAGAAVAVWFDGLRLMAWPAPLVVLHAPSTTPIWLALAAQMLLTALAIFIMLRGRAAFFTGLAFFYVAILPSSRIVSEGALPPFLLERMLYLSSVGLVLALAAGFASLAVKFSLRTPVIVAALAVVMLMPVTWARNNDWANELRLLEGDFAKQPNSRQLLISVLRANSETGRAGRADEICRQADALIRQDVHLMRECGRVYAAVSDFSRAESLFRAALARDPNRAWIQFELARLYVSVNRQDEARRHFEMALSNERFPFIREIMQAIMLIDLWPEDIDRRQQARTHLETALQLQPRSVLARKLLAELDLH